MEKFDYTKQPGRMRTRTYSPPAEEALVSIITPFYNAGRYFEQTFNSVVNQTFPWFEWIIVNDGSTNQEDVKVLERFAAQDKRIKVVHQKNGGLSCARNTGIQHTSTNYFVPLDADDLLSPQFLEYTYWGLQLHPDAAWCYTNSCGFQRQEYIWKHHFDAQRLKTDNFLVATAMICKDAALSVGCYKVEKWSYYEDWRFWLNMLEKHYKPVHTDGVHFWYRRMDTAMLSSVMKDPERVAFCDRIIQEAAAQADDTIQAYEFPFSRTQEQFYHPTYQTWNRLSDPDAPNTKVLWLLPWLEMGGADKFNLDAIKGLTSNGYKNCIITTFPGQNQWLQSFEEYTDEIYSLPQFLDPAHYIEFISYFIQSRQVKVLICSNSYDGYYMLPWLRAHFPDLVIVDYVHMEEWYWRAGGYARTSGMMEGITERTWVCNSETRRVLINNFGRSPESVECLYIGVDDKQFHPQAGKPQYLHQMLHLPEERPIVLFPCRIHPQKRPFMLLDIAKEVQAQYPEAAFVVVGDGPQLEEMKQTALAKGLENTVYFIGRTSHMLDCYRDSKVTLICSLKEGLALTAYESCAMGVPVVSSDVGGQHDLIDSSVGALLPLMQDEAVDLDTRAFPPEEVKQYADSLLRILRDEKLQRRLGTAARKKIEQGFTITNMNDKLDAQLTYLCTDAQAISKRREAAARLQACPGLVDDYYTIYQMWNRQSVECEEVWAARCWFMDQMNLYHQLADERLQQIDSMRSSIGWRMVEKYRKFVEHSKLGKAVNHVLQSGKNQLRKWKNHHNHVQV